MCTLQEPIYRFSVGAAHLLGCRSQQEILARARLLHVMFDVHSGTTWQFPEQNTTHVILSRLLAVGCIDAHLLIDCYVTQSHVNSYTTLTWASPYTQLRYAIYRTTNSILQSSLSVYFTTICNSPCAASVPCFATIEQSRQNAGNHSLAQ